MEQNHIWQVEVAGNIYETDFAGLTQWIAESSLLPEDRIRRENMPWIQAKLVPALAPYFAGKEPLASENISNGGENYDPSRTNTSAGHSSHTNFGISAPSTSTNFAAPEPVMPAQVVQEPEPEPEPVLEIKPDTTPAPVEPAISRNVKVCAVHSEREAQMTCRQCLSFFCEECPKTIARVKICPQCGDLCSPLGVAPVLSTTSPRVQNKNASGNSRGRWSQKEEVYVDPNFTFADFGAALSYPFKFPGALIGGALINAVLSVGMYLGMVTLSVGGLFPGLMTVLVCGIVSTAVVYGCAARAVKQTAYGKSDESFMLDTEDFSIWDTILRPCFLGIATCAVSFAPLLLVGLLIFKVGAGAAVEMNKHAEELKAQQQKQLAQLASAPSPNTYRDPLELEIEGTSRQSEADAIQRIQTISKTANAQSFGPGMTAPKSSDEMQKEMVEAVMKKVGPRIFPLLLGLFIALLWGAFYFPTALAVAGYTESIGATLNPLVGFGMMRQMGANYIKASGGYALLTIIAFSIYIAVGVFSMIFGQAIGQFFINIIAFYFYIATGALFGFALYRSHKKLGFTVAN